MNVSKWSQKTRQQEAAPYPTQKGGKKHQTKHLKIMKLVASCLRMKISCSSDDTVNFINFSTPPSRPAEKKKKSSQLNVTGKFDRVLLTRKMNLALPNLAASQDRRLLKELALWRAEKLVLSLGMDRLRKLLRFLWLVILWVKEKGNMNKISNPYGISFWSMTIILLYIFIYFPFQLAFDGSFKLFHRVNRSGGLLLKGQAVFALANQLLWQPQVIQLKLGWPKLWLLA